MKSKTIKLSLVPICFVLFSSMGFSIEAIHYVSSSPEADKTSMSGIWEAYPGLVISPKDLDGVANKPVYVKLKEKQWVDQSGFHYPMASAFTFRTHISTPSTIGTLAIRVGIVGSSYRLFYNGVLISEVGRPNERLVDTVEEYRNEVVVLPAPKYQSSVGELVIQVSNYSDIAGGFYEIPKIGELQNLELELDRENAILLIFLGVCFAIGLYHLARFAFYSKELSYLFFSLVCLACGLRILTTGILPIDMIFTEIDFRTINFLNFTSFVLLVVFFMFFIATLYQKKWRVICASVIAVIGASYIVFLVVSPVAGYKILLPYFQIVSVIAALIALGILIKSIREKRTGSLILLLGFVVLFLTSVSDMVSVTFLIPLPSLSLYGILFFVFVQAVVLAYNHAVLTNTSNKLSKRLQTINDAQARFMPQELMNHLESDSIEHVRIGDKIELNFDVLVCGFDLGNGDLGDRGQKDEHLNLTLINRLHMNIGPLVRSHGGFILSYKGNGFISLFEGGIVKTIQCAQDIIAQGDLGAFLHGEAVTINAAIHNGKVVIGLVGEDERLNAEVLSNHQRVTENLLQKGSKLGARLSLSKVAMQSVPALEKYQYRPMGTIMVEGNSEVVYDFFDSDPSEIWKKKRSTKRALNQGLRAYALGKTNDARQILSELRSIWPSDPVVNYHLEKME